MTCGAAALMAGMMVVQPVFAEDSAAASPAELLAKESETKCAETAKDKPSPQLIVDKVNKAVELIAKEGEAAFPKFKGKDSEFLFGGTYVWIHNLDDGVMRVHPIKYKMEGKNHMNLKSVDGKLIFADMNRLVDEKGSGWYQYVWPKPGSKDPATKVSYVKVAKKDGKSYVIGCGVYDLTMEEVEKSGAK
jgi:signal transduction histidine kinase